MLIQHHVSCSSFFAKLQDTTKSNIRDRFMPFFKIIGHVGRFAKNKKIMELGYLNPFHHCIATYYLYCAFLIFQRPQMGIFKFY